MAGMYGRYRRVCGVVVVCAGVVYRRWCTVCMALCGYGVRCYGVVWVRVVSVCVYVVYIVL